MDDIMIQYQGFHPSDFTKNYLDSKLSEILNQAPYGSTLRAVFSRKNKTLIAHVRIISKAGQFFATAQGLHMREVSHKLSERVRRQLNRWKTIRFRNRRLRDAELPQSTEDTPHDDSVA